MRFFILTTAVMFSFSANANLDAKFAQEEMQTLAKKSKVQLSDISMYASVGEGENLKVLLDNNGSKVMIPASISKVATASAVLATFPPGHKFKTQIWTTGDVDKKGILKGNVYLKGGGDPSFVSENMWFLVNAFLRNDIKRVEGDIVVDDSLFDKMRYDISRQKERVDRAYDAPVGAMSFNWNSINIFVRPGAKAGDDARVYADPENEYIRLVAKTKTKSSAGEVFADRKEDPKFDGDLLHVGGSIGVNAKEVTIFKNITQPDLWSGYNLKAFLSQRGVTVTGAVKTGNTPSTAALAAEAESKAIEAIVADMNKFSNNYVAEMLTKNMGTLKKEKGVTLADGMVAIQEHMQALQIPKDQYHLESPSGLTRENKMSSFAMWKVLQHLRNDFRVQPEFLQSLPIAGIDGTLKKRMKGTNAERWVRAKTGYINNVVSLAGYAGLEDGRVITFSFIYNGSTDEAAVRQYFDNLLKSLLK